MVPRYYELISWRSRLTDLSGMPFLEIAQPHLSTWDQFMKRAFDLCISSAVLLVTSPLLLVVAVGVKLSSPGPVFFRQVRLGRHAEPFTVTKFRSMTTGTEPSRARVGDAAAEATTPTCPLHELRKKKDESGRITRFGAFLRRTGIDEIPQFINVFKGDMSVVGPAPVHPERVQRRGLGHTPLRGAAGHHGALAGLGSQRPDPQRPRAARLPLRGVVVAVVGPQDHVRDAQDDGPWHRRLLTGPHRVPFAGSSRLGRDVPRPVRPSCCLRPGLPGSTGIAVRNRA